MWLPTPVYERVPQFFFLIGLQFVANGLYLGFEFSIAFFYIGFGLLSCGYGVSLHLMRMQHRQAKAGDEPAQDHSDQAERSDSLEHVVTE